MDIVGFQILHNGFRHATYYEVQVDKFEHLGVYHFIHSLFSLITIPNVRNNHIAHTHGSSKLFEVKREHLLLCKITNR